MVIRKNNQKNAVYVSVIEPHGQYDPVSEIASDAFSKISNVSLLHDDQQYTAVRFDHSGGKRWILLMSNEDNTEDANHQVSISNEIFKWQGPFKLISKTKS
jgi:hypothetical protein